jgi:hypothetical protein
VTALGMIGLPKMLLRIIIVMVVMDIILVVREIMNMIMVIIKILLSW